MNERAWDETKRVVGECIDEWERTNAPGVEGKREVAVANFLDLSLKVGLFVRFPDASNTYLVKLTSLFHCRRSSWRLRSHKNLLGGTTSRRRFPSGMLCLYEMPCRASSLAPGLA